MLLAAHLSKSMCLTSTQQCGASTIPFKRSRQECGLFHCLLRACLHVLGKLLVPWFSSGDPTELGCAIRLDCDPDCCSSRSTTSSPPVRVPYV